MVKDRRKGSFKAVAIRDFDTEADEFYPIATEEFVSGMSTDWEPGEEIPARRGISTVEIREGH